MAKSSRNSPKSLKSDKRYKDGPRYPVIYQYEDDFKNSWKGIMNIGLLEFKKELSRQLTGKREIVKGSATKPLQKVSTKQDLAKKVLSSIIKDNSISNIPYNHIGNQIGLAECSVERILLDNLKSII